MISFVKFEFFNLHFNFFDNRDSIILIVLYGKS